MTTYVARKATSTRMSNKVSPKCHCLDEVLGAVGALVSANSSVSGNVPIECAFEGKPGWAMRAGERLFSRVTELVLVQGA